MDIDIDIEFTEREEKNTKTLTPDHSRVIHLGQSCTLHGSNVGGLVVSRQASSGSCFCVRVRSGVDIVVVMCVFVGFGLNVMRFI